MIVKTLLILCAVLVFCDCKSIVGGNYDFSTLEPTTSEDNGKEYNRIEKPNKKEYFVSTEKLSWKDAKKACQKMGMALVTTTTYNEQIDFQNYLHSNVLIPEDQYSGYWIGSMRQSTWDPWFWTVNDEEITNDFVGWLPYEPSLFEGKDCMEFKNNWGTLGWNNYYCNALRRYACESSTHITNELKKNFLQKPEETLHEELSKDVQTKEKIETSTREPFEDNFEDDYEVYDLLIDTERPFYPQYNFVNGKYKYIHFFKDEAEDTHTNQYADLTDDYQKLSIDNWLNPSLKPLNHSTINQQPLQQIDLDDMPDDIKVKIEAKPIVSEYSEPAELEPNQEPASTAATANDGLGSTSENLYVQSTDENDENRELRLSLQEMEGLQRERYWGPQEDTNEDLETYDDYYSMDDDTQLVA